MYRQTLSTLFFLLAAVLVPNLAHASIRTPADDTNDILMLNDDNCDNFGDQMQCTATVADYCCFATMPFCWVALNDAANVDYSLTAWANTNSCPTSTGSPQKCTEGYCGCLDANTAGSTTAACSALWSYSQPSPPRRVEARSLDAVGAGCRPADTLRYTDATTGLRRVVRNITRENFEEVMDLYSGKRYAELEKIAVPL